jgi:DNA-binding NarL/FixJ family response regulator
MTSRDFAVIDLVSVGYTNKQIVTELKFGSEQVVKNRLRRIYCELQLDGYKLGKRVLLAKWWQNESQETRIKALDKPAIEVSRPEMRLTPRDIEVLKLAVLGMTNREIGERMGNSRQMISNRIRGIFDLIGAENRVQMVSWWITRGRQLYGMQEGGSGVDQKYQHEAQTIR